MSYEVQIAFSSEGMADTLSVYHRSLLVILKFSKVIVEVNDCLMPEKVKAQLGSDLRDSDFRSVLLLESVYLLIWWASSVYAVLRRRGKVLKTWAMGLFSVCSLENKMSFFSFHFTNGSQKRSDLLSGTIIHITLHMSYKAKALHFIMRQLKEAKEIKHLKLVFLSSEDMCGTIAFLLRMEQCILKDPYFSF